MENKNNKKIIIAVGVLVVAVAVFLAVKNITFAPIAEENNLPADNTASSTSNGTDQVKPEPEQTQLPSNTPKDLAWAVFQKYLAYNKNNDLNGVKSVVYKVNPVCASSAVTDECKSRMGLAYVYGSVLRKEDFKNVWSDEKQIILTTDFWLESSVDLDQYGRFRSIIFFVKGTDNEWKLLSFSPTAGGAVNKGAASQEEIDARLLRYTEDNDKDGKFDYEEECLNKPGDLSCIKTSTKLRDTNGNGLWDGVDALMK